MSDRIRFIPSPVDGRNVLLIDLSGFANTLDSLPFIAEARETVAIQAQQSLCCIVEVCGSRFNIETVEALPTRAEAFAWLAVQQRVT